MSIQLFPHETTADFAKPSYLDSLFNTDKTLLFLNDRLDLARKKEIENQLAQSFKENNFFLIPTSGSTSFTLKLVVLSKQAVLNSAQRVGQFFSFKENENWLLTIPTFHIGGLAVLARAFLFKQQVFLTHKWSPSDFVSTLSQKNIHYTSLVPTQIHDLISFNLKAPDQLKIVFVGGGLLSSELFMAAKKLGWPIIKTFGMTETSSMIAFGNSPELTYQFFPNCDAIINNHGFLAIKTDSLFSGYLIEDLISKSFHFQSITETMNDYFWVTEDLAEIKGTELYLKGRAQDMIKIKGELVNLNALRNSFNKLNKELANPLLDSTIIAIRHARNEHELILVIESKSLPADDTFKDEIKNALAMFNQSVLPFERVSTFVFLKNIEKTELGKIKYASFNTEQFQEYLNENRQTIME